MPLRATDQTRWSLRPTSVLGAPALRRIEWELPPPAFIGRATAGAASWSSPHGPGSFYLHGHDITSERKEDLEHPPQRHVRQKLESLQRDNRLRIEWIALGRTESCFWTATQRLIAGLESQVKFSLQALDSA